MKNFTPVLLLLLASFAVQAQEKHDVTFETTSWADIMAKAKAENRLVFLDAFADWCGPCKWMDKNVFATAEASAVFNANFVNAKIDMEKGEGVDLRKKYDVKFFPTYLFIDGDGKVVHKLIGSQPLPDFLKSVGYALKPETQYATLLDKLNAGETNPEQLFLMANVFRSAYNDEATGLAASAYLKHEKDWLSEKNIKFISDFTTSVDEDKFPFMRSHPKEFTAAIGAEAYEQKMYWLPYETALNNVTLTKETTKEQGTKYITDATAYFKKVIPENAEKLSSNFAIKIYSKTGDEANYVKQVQEHYKKFPAKDWTELNSVAWNFFQVIDNPVYLKEGVKYAEQSIKLDENFSNLDTIANLYAKLKDKAKTKEWATRAIAVGKKEGEDVSAMEALLK